MRNLRFSGPLLIVATLLAACGTQGEDPAGPSGAAGGKSDSITTPITLRGGETLRIDVVSDSGLIEAALQGTSPAAPVTMALYALDLVERCDDVVGANGQAIIEPVAFQAGDAFPFLAHDADEPPAAYCVVLTNEGDTELRTQLVIDTTAPGGSTGCAGTFCSGGFTSDTASDAGTGTGGCVGTFCGDATTGNGSDTDTATGTSGCDGTFCDDTTDTGETGIGFIAEPDVGGA